MKQSDLSKHITDNDLAYIAGIVDGEGSIAIKKVSYKDYYYYYPCVAIYNTNDRLFEWLKSRIGGIVSIHIKTYGEKTVKRWRTNQESAVDLLNRRHGYSRPLGRRVRTVSLYIL